LLLFTLLLALLALALCEAVLHRTIDP
jgi:hypothetical protein